jgi:hypothetical protein
MKACGIVAALGWLCLSQPARAQWQVASPDGKSSLKLGLLGQGQAEFVEVPEAGNPDGLDISRNLFLRRFRILGGGNLSDKLSFFFETDSPNLGKANAAGTKEAGDIYLQDFFVTYSFRDELKVEGGLMLTPNSHNSETSAAALLPIDYGPYSFLESTPTGSRVGRDYGVQLRGYLAKHFEYRLGVYQGYRGENSTEPFRYVGRVVFYLFDPETGFFYTGTSLGTKKIVAIGLSADFQDTYQSYGGDFFLDLPFANGDGVTLQGDYLYFDGDTTFKTLLVQNDWLAEAGYYNKKTRLGPFAQVAVQDFADPNRPDENRWQGGLAYWSNGHKFNLKLGYTYLAQSQVRHRNQLVLQCQVFQF